MGPVIRKEEGVPQWLPTLGWTLVTATLRRGVQARTGTERHSAEPRAPHPHSLICLKSQGLDRHTQKQMPHASGTLPTRLSKAAGSTGQEGKATRWMEGVGSSTCRQAKSNS